MTAFPDAAYLVLSSRLIPGLDGGYTIATLARARQMADAGVDGGRGPQLLTFDPGTAAAHAEHRATFAAQSALGDPALLRNLFDEAAAPGGGAADWLRQTATAGDADDADIEYRTLTDADGRPFAALPVIPGNPDWHLTTAPVVVYDEEGVAGVVPGFRGLYRAWLEHVVAGLAGRPVVVICESRQLGELIADWSHHDVRIIHTIHTMHVEPPYTPDAPLNALWRRWFAVAPRFDAVAWPTESQRRDVEARFGRDAVNIVVPNGVDAAEAAVQQRTPRSVVSLGRLAPGKRFDHAIRAFAAADVPDATLEIWGEGPERDRLQAEIDRLGVGDRVRLAGHTDDPGAVLDGAAVFVTSTAYEGQGLALAEAAAHGCPVVTYDVRYGPGDLLDAGGGILVPDGDEAALADALRRVLTDGELHARLAAEAPRAASRWDPPHAMAALAAAARDVLAAPPRR